MSLRPARKTTLPSVPDPEGAPSSGDDEIEILEVTGVNETERPLDLVPPIEPVPVTDPGPEEDHAAEQQARARAERERDQQHDLWMRAQADLDNMKKRFEREAGSAG